MPQPFHRLHRAHTAAAVLVIAVVAMLASTASARAGVYTVNGTCGLWTPYNADPNRIAVFNACPGLVARNTYGNFTTSAGVGGGWRFDALAGTQITSVTLQGVAEGHDGWQATIYSEGPNGRELFNCPGASCPGASAYIGGEYQTYGATALVLRMRCGASACSNNVQHALLDINGANFVVSDYTAPAAALTAGTFLSSGWRGGTQTLVIDGSDNTGIQELRAVIDGSVVRSARRGCSYGPLVPCTNGTASLEVPTTGLADGPHAVAGEVVDGSGNVSRTSPVTVYTDNSAPSQPLDIRLEGASGWRTRNAFSLTWRNPPQTFAPIVAAIYRLCPHVATTTDADTRPAARARCVQGSRSGPNISKLETLELPNPGLWDAEVWLVDAAGNQQPTSAVEIDALGFDDTPPSSVAFLGPDPQDPARVHVEASDTVSGLAGGAIEVRRDGQTAWQPLPTEVTASGLSAFMDDETLPKGLYFLRARVVDAAGLESSNDRDATGQPAMLKLPIRLASRVSAGRKGKRSCRGHGRHRRCRRRLATKPRVAVGRATRLYGRLTVAGKPMPGAAVEVWRRLDVAGAPWARIATVVSSRTGRFSYRARRGPARLIRFRYPGTSMIRGRNGDVALRVRASTTIRPNRRLVINGEDVIFRGQLEGGWIPATGVLVELQVYSRGQWRTFAQPRARAGTGRWAYRYRFETVRGRASFRFRARVRRQPGYPFTTGASRPVRVKVRGL